MTQVYNTPKEMLGYIIIQSMQKILEIIPSMPYDRRAVISFYQELRYIDSQLVTFREDMYLISDDHQRVNYFDAMKQISQVIKDNYSNIFAKDFEEFLNAAYKWSELLASAYPKLGLVPETGEMSRIYQEENIIENVSPEQSMDQIKEDTNESPAVTPIERQPEPEPSREQKPSVHRTNSKPGFRFL